jgi:plastocyanin
MPKNVLILLVVVLSGLILAGCASKTPEPVSFTIDMTEYAFSPETLEVEVGQQVTLNLVNKGQLPHEIMFGRDVVMVNNRPSGYEHDMFDEAGVEPMVMGMEEDEHMGEEDEQMGEEDEHMEGDDHEEDEHADESDLAHEGFMVLLKETGDQGTISFTVTEDMVGEWEIGCFELDGVHYDAGMVGTFVVTQ